MALPTYAVGQVLGAADCNINFMPQVVVKPSDQSVTSSTALVSDTALVAAVSANFTYRVELFLIYTGATSAADIKWTWAVPSGASMSYTAAYIDTSGAVQAGNYHVDSDTFGAGTGGTGSNRSVLITGNLLVGATAGNLQFRWAQNTSNATATTVRARSHLIVRRIA